MYTMDYPKKGKSQIFHEGKMRSAVYLLAPAGATNVVVWYAFEYDHELHVNDKIALSLPNWSGSGRLLITIAKKQHLPCHC